MKQQHQEKNNPGIFISLRIDSRFVEAFDEEMDKRGLTSRNEGLRHLIAAWCREPDALAIGLPTKAKQ